MIFKKRMEIDTIIKFNNSPIQCKYLNKLFSLLFQTTISLTFVYEKMSAQPHYSSPYKNNTPSGDVNNNNYHTPTNLPNPLTEHHLKLFT